MLSFLCACFGVHLLRRAARPARRGRIEVVLFVDLILLALAPRLVVFVPALLALLLAAATGFQHQKPKAVQPENSEPAGLPW